jgi:SAM-dependent MidA family methyltransferase
MKATTALRKIIHERGPLDFADYMNLCLYHPQHGYYAQEPRQVGREGDFFTSVSCGPLFGILIAEHIAAWWCESSISGPWRILEPGANNAALALDILTYLRRHHPDAFLDLEYVTIDPLPAPRQFQKQALDGFGPQVQCLANTIPLTPCPTFVIANEVLDAFPCHMIERGEDGWLEVWVECTGQEMELREILRPNNLPLPPLLSTETYPLGYRTEVREAPQAFLDSLRRCMIHGRMLFFDYGFAQPEYYDPQRKSGTLRVYRNHRASEDALENPGLCDLTAHVDFTAVMESAHRIGMQALRFEPQEFFLSRLMKRLLQQGNWDDSWQRNLQTLIHPAHLGGKFHALELSIAEQQIDDALALQRLAFPTTAH